MFIRIFSVAYNLLIINIIVFSYLTMAYAKTNNKFSSTPCVNKFTIYSKIKNIKNVNSLTQSNNNALDKNRTFARLINNYRINILLQYSDDSIFESDFNFRFFKQFSLQMSYFLRPYQVLEKNIPNHFNNVNQIAEKLSIYSTNLAFGFPKNKSYYIRIFAGRAIIIHNRPNQKNLLSSAGVYFSKTFYQNFNLEFHYKNFINFSDLDWSKTDEEINIRGINIFQLGIGYIFKKTVFGISYKISIIHGETSPSYWYSSLLQGIDNTGSSAHYDFNIFMNFWI